jgi:hypothetical protein
LGRGILIQRRLSGGIAAVFVALCMIAAALLPLVSDHARAVEYKDPYMTVTGEADGALAGRSVALMDIDGDGKADLIVGDPLDSENGDFSGKVMIYLGGAPKTVPDAVILGCEGEMFGLALARAGDVNGDVDNIDDLIVGAPRNDTTSTDAGVAYIFYGGDVSSLPAKSSGADKTIVGEDFRGELGRAVSTAGDLNSDGSDDVLIGVPNTGAGKVYVLYGGSSMDTTPDKTFYGSNVGDQFGFAVAGGANLDGTSAGDIVIGAPKTSSGKGATCVLLNVAKASPKRVTLTGDVDGDQLGYSVAVLDFNDDGMDDVAAGAPYANSVGEVGIYYGGAIAGKFDRTVDVVLSTGEAGDEFGFAIASGDPRTDDIGDLVVGAPGDDTGGADAGRAYVFYGDSIADDVPDLIVNGTDVFGSFGYCVASGTSKTADYNGDEAADFAVGAPESTSTRGAAYLYLGYEVEVPDKPQVFGYILDATDLTPLGGALVTIECQAPVFEMTVRTLANGSYGLDEPIEVSPGTYEISASYIGYFSDSVEGVELANDDERNVTLELYKFPEISGTIYDGATYPTLDPLEDADVEVRSATGTLLYSATTDELGAYSFVLEDESDLGDLTIEASKQDYFDNSTAKTIAGGAEETIDMVLQHKPCVEVHVVDAAVKPPADEDLADVSVIVSIGGIVVATGTTDSDGEATLIVNGQGLAYVNTSKPGYVPGGSGPVTLVENTTTTIPEISMDRRPSVSGTVYGAPDIEPISEAYVELLEAGTTNMLMDDTTDSDGYYTFDVAAPDTYDIRVTAAEYMREVRDGVLVDPNEEVIENFVLSKDPIPPVSTITDPVKPGVGDPPTILEDPVFDLTVDASDANGISSVDLYVSFDDGDFELWAEDEEEPYVFTFDTSKAYGDGVYAFYTRAWDLAENEEAAPSENDTWIIMNTGTPFSYVDEISPYEQSTTTFTVTAIGDDPFGVLYVELWYRFDGGTYEEYAQDDTLPYTWEFEATEGDGVYDFYSILVNGLVDEEDEPDEPDASALVDTTPPVITVDPPIDPVISTASVDLSVTFSDAGSGLSTVSYQVDSDDPEMLDVDEGSSEFVLDETLSGLADGVHTILLSATDMVEWETTEEISFVVDTGDPSVTIEAPLDGEAINTVTVEARWVIDEPVSGIESIEVWLDDGDPEDATGLDSYTFDDLDDGEHTITVYVVSVAGGDDTATTTFEVDTIDPTVVIREPVDGALIVTTNVFVRWEQSDLGSGLEKVEVRLDDGDWEIVTVNSTTIPNVDEGTHTVQVNATDKAGNWDMDEVTFGVDGTPPEITLLSPEDGFVYDTGSVEASWEVTDDGTGVDVDTVEYKLDTSPWADAGAAVGTMTLPPLSEGTHSFSMRASDLAGNDAAVEMVSFTVDTVDPTVAIDYEVLPSHDVLATYTSDGTGTDVVLTEIRLNGGDWEVADSASTTFSGLVDEEYTIEVRVTDEAGNTGTDSVTFVLDSNPPIVYILSPDDDEIVGGAPVTVEWSATDLGSGVSAIEIKLDDGVGIDVTGETSYEFSDLDEGSHTVTVSAIDGGGNDDVASVTFEVDKTAPTVLITTPANGAILASADILVAWTATDSSSGVDTVEGSLDGGAWTTVTGSPFALYSLTDGDHELSLRATDAVGNTATAVSVSFSVDTVAPELEITAPTEGAYVGGTVEVTWTVTDAGSGVETVEVRLDGGTWTVASGSSETFSDLESGEHTVDVRATDFVDNEATDSVTFTVSIDTTAPTVAITSPTNGSSLPSSSVTVTWAASDGTGSGIDTVEVKLDGGAWTVVTTSSRSFTGLADGSHTVSVRVTDNASNSATIGVTFVVDTVDPTLTITSPEDGMDTRDTTVTVTWTCTDTGCGIDRIEVSIDGESYISVGTASERAFTGLAVGDYTVDVRAYDKAGNMVEASIDFTVSEGGGISALLIGGIVLAIIVAAVVAVMLMRRKKAPAPPSE